MVEVRERKMQYAVWLCFVSDLRRVCRSVSACFKLVKKSNPETNEQQSSLQTPRIVCVISHPLDLRTRGLGPQETCRHVQQTNKHQDTHEASERAEISLRLSHLSQYSPDSDCILIALCVAKTRLHPCYVVMFAMMFGSFEC